MVDRPLDDCSIPQKPGTILLYKKCTKCGKENIPWGPDIPRRYVCDGCIVYKDRLNKPHTDMDKRNAIEYQQQYIKEHPVTEEQIKKHSIAQNKQHQELSDIIHDKPCFLCEYGTCAGSYKMIVSITGKTLEEEIGVSGGVVSIPKRKIPELFDENRFVIMCLHHASQFLALQRYHEEWSFDVIIDEMIARMQ